jgi:hypothetical protein
MEPIVKQGYKGKNPMNPISLKEWNLRKKHNWGLKDLEKFRNRAIECEQEYKELEAARQLHFETTGEMVKLSSFSKFLFSRSADDYLSVRAYYPDRKDDLPYQDLFILKSATLVTKKRYILSFIEKSKDVKMVSLSSKEDDEWTIAKTQKDRRRERQSRGIEYDHEGNKKLYTFHTIAFTDGEIDEKSVLDWTGDSGDVYVNVMES